MFKFLINWFINSTAWKRLASHMIGGLNFRFFGYPKFNMIGYHRIRHYLIKSLTENEENNKIDDIHVFVGTDADAMTYKLNNFFTGSHWSHSGFVFYNMYDDRVMIEHMIGKGFVFDDVLNYLRTIDQLRMFKLPIKDKTLFYKMLSKVRETDEIDYDYTLGMNDKLIPFLKGEIELPEGSKLFDMYCSELIYALARDNCEVNLEAVSRFGRLSFTPDDLAIQLKDFEVEL